jgi:hypothetical protein
LLYFEHPAALSIIAISTKGSSSGKEVALVVILAIAIQKRNTIIKTLDFYYKNKNKLNSFLSIFIRNRNNQNNLYY